MKIFAGVSQPETNIANADRTIVVVNESRSAVMNQPTKRAIKQIAPGAIWRKQISRVVNGLVPLDLRLIGIGELTLDNYPL